MTLSTTAELLKKAVDMERNKNNNALPRLEFHQNIQWAPAYQRNNKANGQKNLRCFPSHCQGLGHQRGFCGHSIVVNFYYIPSSVKGQLYSFGHFCIADCELVSAAAAVAKGVSRDRFFPGDIIPVEQVKERIRTAENPLKEYVEGLELQDRRVDADGSVRVNFEFNRNLKGWHYGFLGSKLTRNVHHTFKAYVMEKVEATAEKEAHFRVIAAVTSPDWTLFCRRRNRASIPTSAQVRQQQLKQQALLLQKQQELLEEEERLKRQGIVQEQKEGLDDNKLLSGMSTKSNTSIPSGQMRAPPPLHPNQYQAPPLDNARRVKKRRDSTPAELGSCSGSVSASSCSSSTASSVSSSSSSSSLSENGASKVKPPRRYTSCPSTHSEDVEGSYYDDPYSRYQPYHSSREQTSPLSYVTPLNHQFAHSQHTNQYDRHHSQHGYHLHEQQQGRSRGFTMPQLPMYDAGQFYENESCSSSNNETIKQFFRRRASQERLAASGRSGLQRKRTSSDSHTVQYQPNQDSENNGSNKMNGAWPSFFAGSSESGLLRHPSLPMLLAAKASASQLVTAPDSRQVTLLLVLGMIDIRFTPDSVNGPLHLRDPGQVHLMASSVSDLVEMFLSDSDTPSSPLNMRDGFKPDSYHFAKFMMGQKAFINDLVKFGKKNSVDTRKSEPYATVSFILSTIRTYLRSFMENVPTYVYPAKGENGELESDVGSLYPCMSTLSLKDGFFDSLLNANQNKLSPRACQTNTIKSNKPSSSSSSSSALTPSSSSTMLMSKKKKDSVAKANNKKLASQPEGPEMDLDLEQFTQDLEPLTCGNGTEEDDFVLRATKSWKAMGNARLSAKFSNPFFGAKLSAANLSALGKKLSEHSFMGSSFLGGKNKKTSMASLGNMPSLFQLTETEFKQGDNSMKELDDFLKKECGVQEVEEVDG